ncbi:RHS repeat domain-containing protein [Marilutibacter chinensis]|uniref:RHS repeat protein n=1 Tax=Marilutibacter chinensis TaxID=2912247 RepID=A0ABS9HWF5_9GAMM|nr:RHS repeat-associated core domain-containing protein [Lysobacter chinensis]MCF7223231.1 RHS repeat protein [Lysobacter chinensis]
MAEGIGQGWMARLGAVAALVAVSGSALAIEPYQEYRKRVEAAQNLTALKSDLFGDSVSLYNGKTEFVVTDIDIPGNSALPVQLQRRFNVEIHLSGSSTGFNSNLGGAGGWDVEVPYISGMFSPVSGWSDQRCSVSMMPTVTNGFSVNEIWQGNTIHIPGGGDRTMLRLEANTPRPSDGVNRLWTTASRDAIDCIPMQSGLSGEGFRITTTEGVQYHFDIATTRYAGWMNKPLQPPLVGYKANRSRVFLLASKVVDRFGNTVQYQYDANGHPTRVWSSDGREIWLTYSGGQLQTATAAGRTWNYGYTTVEGQMRLSTVTRPDNSQWAYTYSNALMPSYVAWDGNSTSNCAEQPPEVTASFILTAKHPSGAQGTFNFSNARHYRSGVHMSACLQRISSGTYYYELNTPNFFDVMTLYGKRIEGVGLAPQVWSYSYGGGYQPLWGTRGSAAIYPCTQCDVEKTVVVTNPDNTKTRYRYGFLYAANEGKLLGSSVLDAQGGVLRSETTTYMSDAEAANQSFAPRYGIGYDGSDPSVNKVRPVVSSTVVQDGVTFSLINNSFDTYARPLSVSRSNTQGNSRTDVSAYHDDTTLWVLGQIKSVTNVETGGVVSQTDYGWNSMPRKRYSFGRLVQEIGYNTSDGTVSYVKDGAGNTTTLSSWKRGIPQAIAYADATSQSAVVNADGTIASVIDENGYKTCYAYDAMGRLSKITYPSETSTGICDTTWNATTQSFVPIGVSEYGIPAGHWRQDVATGNGRRKTYFDALWRPLLVREYDAGNVAATERFTRFAYDHEGRTTFASYPATGSNPVTGIRTTYDALGRTTHVRQDSELDLDQNGTPDQLLTRTEYLSNASGYYTKVTNPRQKITHTWYQAFDQPSYDNPVAIWHGEGAVTYITRDVFGKPTRIRRSNSTSPTGGTTILDRHYLYGGAQRLCMVTEPETGSEVVWYDGADNLIRSAAGLNVAAGTSCADAKAQALSSGRVVARSYDARNRIITLTFPDGRGNTTHTYWPDGQPHTITADNGDGNLVTTSYGYNHRRLPVRERMQWNSIDWAISHSYNANGHRSAQSWHGITVDYAPNALGQPTRAGGYASNVSYFPNGAIKQFTYGNGIVHTLTQNARGLPDTSTDAYGSTKFLSDGYDYDQNGNVAAITDGATGRNQRGNRTMTYDGLDRLTGTTSPMFGTATYAYDVLDNLTRVKLSGGTAARDHYYCYGSANRLAFIRSGPVCTGSSASPAVQALTWDVQGNLSDKSGQTFEFDYGNRLRSATVGAVTSQYAYDGLGRRVWDYTSHNKYSQYTQSGELAMTVDQRKSVISEYIYLAGSLIATRERYTPTNTYTTKYQHTDALGSPVVVTDASRNVIERSEYEPYGKVLNRPLKDGLGYTGHVEDAATGLIYAQQRYYDDDIGRFLSADPVTAYDDGDLRFFNRYSYATNAPYTFTDPDGREIKPVGTRAEIRAIKRALKRIERSNPASKARMQAMRASANVHTIRYPQPGEIPENKTTGIRANESNGVGTGSETIVDPTASITTVNSDGTPVISSGETVLAHELLGHGGDKDKGVMDRSINPETGERKSEERAMGAENEYKDAVGESRRNCHSQC